MNVTDELRTIMCADDPTAAFQAALKSDPLLWVRFLRRHKANIFDALFLDRDRDMTADDVTRTVRRVADFFALPVPVVSERAATIAEVMTSEHAAECDLYYNWREMQQTGINNRETLTLAFVHEMAHQYLFTTRFLLFQNELWVQELAADFLVGAFSVLDGDVATGKYKYVVSLQKATLTHPDGSLREEVVVYGRDYVTELLRQDRYNTVGDLLAGLPAFIFSHLRQLQMSWNSVSLEQLEHEEPAGRATIDYESLPDTNLLKQYWMKHKDDKNKEDKK